MEMINEEDWADYTKALLGRLLTQFHEPEATEIRQAFEDILGWLHSARMSIDVVSVDLVKTARTPIDRERIGRVLEIRQLIDLAEAHLQPIVYCRKIYQDNEDEVVRLQNVCR